MKKFFSLNKDVILVKGYNRGLLQDMKERRIYSIDKTSKELLSRLSEGEEITDVISSLSSEDKERFTHYLQLLVDKKLGFYSDLWIKSEKLSVKTYSTIDTVWLELRKSCNLSCCHCYMDSNITRDKDLNILSLSEWTSIVENLVCYKPKRIILIGGEPLLFKGIEKLIYHIRSKLLNTEIVLYSNLTLVTKDIIQCLSKNKVKVVTSLYSSHGETHDKITGVQGSFIKTVNAIKYLRENNIFVKANTVVMKYNENEVKHIEKFILALTGKKAKFDIIRDIGTTKENLLPYIDKLENRKSKLEFRGISKAEYIKNISGNSCWQGKINISCDGYVSPCIMGEKLIDKSFNVRNNTIEEILKDYLVPRFWCLSRDKLQVCKDCEYRYVCKDCRPIELVDDNIYAKDKNCTYNPYE